MKETRQNQKKGVLVTVLKAFVPYTEENLMLAYKPNQFFNKLGYLDRLAEYSNSTTASVRSTISRAKRNGLLKSDEQGQLRTTWRGNIKARILPRKQLNRTLVIVFDVPESHRKQRDLFRTYLRAMRCETVQKSVWKTRYDIYDELQDALEELQFHQYVQVFLAEEVTLTR